MKQEEQRQIQSRPHTLCGQPTIGKVITISEIAPKDQGVQPVHRSHQSGVLHQKDEPPKHFVEVQWSFLSGKPEDCGKIPLLEST